MANLDVLKGMFEGHEWNGILNGSLDVLNGIVDVLNGSGSVNLASNQQSSKKP